LALIKETYKACLTSRPTVLATFNKKIVS
jgi:hypothetical protein